MRRNAYLEIPVSTHNFKLSHVAPDKSKCQLRINLQAKTFHGHLSVELHLGIPCFKIFSHFNCCSVGTKQEYVNSAADVNDVVIYFAGIRINI